MRPLKVPYGSLMNRFSDAREAKEFLVAQVVDEAQREGVSLSEVERKMLYFTESYWNPYNVAEVNEEFEREHDTAQYEKKIAGLFRKAYNRCKTERPDELPGWSEAVRVLGQEDHYILVMAHEAGIRAPLSAIVQKFRAALIAGIISVGVLFAWLKRSGHEEWFGGMLVAILLGVVVHALVASVWRKAAKR